MQRTAPYAHVGSGLVHEFECTGVKLQNQRYRHHARLFENGCAIDGTYVCRLPPTVEHPQHRLVTSTDYDVIAMRDDANLYVNLESDEEGRDEQHSE